MKRERIISEQWVRFLLLAALLYLFIPNVIFLFGWTILPYAIVSSICLTVTFGFIFLKSVRVAPVSFQGWDFVCLVVTLLLCVLMVECIGFHAHVPQTLDMVVRNPIYEALSRDAWPITHPDGKLFVYYLSYWLPAACLRKCGVPMNPATIIFLWTFMGVALSACVLFVRLKGRVLVFFLVLFMLGMASDELWSHSLLEGTIYPRWQMIYRESCMAFRCVETFRCVPGGWLQFISTFNHAVPALLFFSLLFSRRFYLPGILFAAALMTSFSPLMSVALFPILLVLLLLRYKTEPRKTLVGTIGVAAGCSALLIADGVYFMMGTGSGIHPVWLDSSALILPPIQLMRFAVCITWCGVQFLLLYFVFSGRFRRCYVSYVLPIVFLMIMFIWIGMDGNNELLFKGVMVLWLYCAFLAALSWRKATSIKRKVAIVVLLLVFSFTFQRNFMERMKKYTWVSEQMEQNIQDDWHGSLIHPEHFWNSRFWAKDTKLPFMIKHASGFTRR